MCWCIVVVCLENFIYTWKNALLIPVIQYFSVACILHDQCFTSAHTRLVVYFICLGETLEMFYITELYCGERDFLDGRVHMCPVYS